MSNAKTHVEFIEFAEAKQSEARIRSGQRHTVGILFHDAN